ncbi:MAG: DoxX family protein [Acidobacteriota bacterium]
MTGAAFSELTRQPSVMTGLQALGYPPTLVRILGPAKLAAVAALLLHPRTDLARAAWLGLWINLSGAVASLALAPTAPWPDAVVAPTYLVWISIGALLHERAVLGLRGPEKDAAEHRPKRAE